MLYNIQCLKLDQQGPTYGNRVNWRKGGRKASCYTFIRRMGFTEYNLPSSLSREHQAVPVLFTLLEFYIHWGQAGHPLGRLVSMGTGIVYG